MTVDELRAAGILVDDTSELAALLAESALDYINENTTLSVNKDSRESLEALPACAKLFIVKYSALMEAETGISSESLGGMSQSFDTTKRDSLLFDLANSLLGKYMKSQMHFVPASRRWR